MRFAIVTEGPSDYLVLRAVIQALIPDAEVVPVHPEVPLARYPEYRAADGGARLGAGWRGVQAWCREYGGEDLDLFLKAVVGEEYDALVVHVDASMAHNLCLEAPCPPASATTEPLRNAVLRDWLGLDEVPGFLVLATPSKFTDTWVWAAETQDSSDIECDFQVENLLARRFRFRVRNGEVKKPRAKYEELARAVAANLDGVRKVCGEADRFVQEVQRAALTAS